METIYATRKDGTQVRWEGEDLSATWESVLEDSSYDAGDYYRPRKTKPKLAALFGNLNTTLPL